MKKIKFFVQACNRLIFVNFILFFLSIGVNADSTKILVQGNKRISNETIMLISGLSAQSDISDNVVNEALKKLTKSGLFSEVGIDIDGANILVTVTENRLISEIIFEGNKVASDEDLLLIVGSTARNAYSRDTVLMDVTKLAKFYKNKGRFNAVISPQYINDDDALKLIFNIDEGNLLEVKDVVFIGNKEFSDKKLFSITPSQKKGIFSFITDSDNYSEAILSQDKLALEQFYSRNGFIDIRITSSLALLSPNKSEVTLSYSISEGAKYRIGKIELDTENLNLDERVYQTYMNVQTGDIYDKENT